MTDLDSRADLDQRAVNLIRGWAMDAPRAASSGHPGTAMALAPLAAVLHTRIMKHDPADPDWPDRDRFVLSAGHASILLYSMLHLSGYGLEMDDLRAFRQWGSKTPGHPEVHHTKGIEVTTGPLGQGIANSVGLAIAERWLRARFGADLTDHHTFVIAGDGCMQEGVSHEAASLAGHLGLGRLVVVYDDNHITIDGPTSLSFSDDTATRFEAYGWHVERVGEIANDLDALEQAVRLGMAEEERPSLIVLRSHIGYPSKKYMDTAAAHGNPFDPAEIAAVKEQLGMPPDVSFFEDADALAAWRAKVAERAAAHASWTQRFDAWSQSDPEGRARWDACMAGRGLSGWETKLPTWKVGESVATRRAIGTCFNSTVDVVPGLVAGGADLTENTGTELKGEEQQSAAHPGGRQLMFGVREHGMAAAMNGMALHHGVLPAGGTFFVFSDYLRPALRLAAMSQAKALFVLTHDSVGLGEDGPTHQPVEHLLALRAIPQLRVIRPADANETALAYRVAVDSEGPTALVLSRQNLPVLDGTEGAPVHFGAYVLDGFGADAAVPSLVVIGTGSEVSIALEAGRRLADDLGFGVRVVSMPSWDLFDAQPAEYRDSVLPPGVPTVSVEAGVTLGWSRYAQGHVGIDQFGASAPGAVALANLGITADHVVEVARDLLGGLARA